MHNKIRHAITGILALFGALCLFVVSSIIALLVHGFAREKRQRKTIAERQAEQIIHQLL